MPVAEVVSDVRVEPNHVYVTPPTSSLALIGEVLTLVPRTPPGALSLPIDSFLGTLAEVRGSQSIGVILSGMGSDGTLGVQALEAEGGIVFAQEPASAKHGDMPRSAIESGVVDFVLTPEEIAHELTRLGRHPYLAGAPPLLAPDPAPPAGGEAHEKSEAPAPGPTCARLGVGWGLPSARANQPSSRRVSGQGPAPAFCRVPASGRRRRAHPRRPRLSEAAGGNAWRSDGTRCSSGGCLDRWPSLRRGATASGWSWDHLRAGSRRACGRGGRSAGRHRG